MFGVEHNLQAVSISNPHSFPADQVKLKIPMWLRIRIRMRFECGPMQVQIQASVKQSLGVKFEYVDIFTSFYSTGWRLNAFNFEKTWENT
jgi:hypothetical protein